MAPFSLDKAAGVNIPRRDTVEKAAFYKQVKIAGMALYITFVLVTGPLAGYVLGDFLQKRFGMPAFGVWICIVAGALTSIRETVRIIRRLIRIDKQ